MNSLTNKSFFKPKIIATVVGIGALFFTLYGNEKDGPISLGAKWLHQCTVSSITSEWQHCLIVPFIIAWLMYRKRAELRYDLVIAKGTKSGLIFVLLSLILYFFGFLANLHYLGYFSLQCLLLSLAIWFFGWQFSFKYSFFWWFSWFVWPFYFLGRMIGLPLRHLMTSLAEVCLSILQLNPVREGTAIYSAADPLKGLVKGELYEAEVAVACSGLRSLFALMMISALFGYFRASKAKWQWIYFLSSIPMAVIGNCVRIVLIVLATVWFGEEFAVGTHSEIHGESPSAFHLFAGYFVFIINIAGLILIEKFSQSKGKQNIK